MSKKVYVDLSQQDVQDIINAYEKDIEKFNKQKEVLNKIKEYTNGNIQALENRLNTPFCNFDKTTKELSIYQNYLELLEEIE